MMPKAAGDSHAQQRPDVEDMCIATNTGNAISIHQVQDVQLARKKLASKKKDLNMVTGIRAINTIRILYVHSGNLF